MSGGGSHRELQASENKVARSNLEDSRLLGSEGSLGRVLEQPVWRLQIFLPSGDEGRGSKLALISPAQSYFCWLAPCQDSQTDDLKTKAESYEQKRLPLSSREDTCSGKGYKWTTDTNSVPLPSMSRATKRPFFLTHIFRKY